jgi:predicted nucleotidyltransferase
VGTLSETSLTAEELALVEQFVEDLHARLGASIHAVWLFGSRARGERRSPESDVDLLVLAYDATWDGRMLVREILNQAARKLDLDALAWTFSVHVHAPDWLTERREIRSFFVAELDRDKVVLSEAA